MHVTKIATAALPIVSGSGLEGGGRSAFAEVLQEGGASTGCLCGERSMEFRYRIYKGGGKSADQAREKKRKE